MHFELGEFHTLKMDPNKKKPTITLIFQKKKDSKNGFSSVVTLRNATLLHWAR